MVFEVHFTSGAHPPPKKKQVPFWNGTSCFDCERTGKETLSSPTRSQDFSGKPGFSSLISGDRGFLSMLLSSWMHRWNSSFQCNGINSCEKAKKKKVFLVFTRITVGEIQKCIPDNQMHDLDGGVLKALEKDVKRFSFLSHSADDQAEHEREEHDAQDVGSVLESNVEPVYHFLTFFDWNYPVRQVRLCSLTVVSCSFYLFILFLSAQHELAQCEAHLVQSP